MARGDKKWSLTACREGACIECPARADFVDRMELALPIPQSAVMSEIVAYIRYQSPHRNSNVNCLHVRLRFKFQLKADRAQSCELRTLISLSASAAVLPLAHIPLLPFVVALAIIDMLLVPQA